MRFSVVFELSKMELPKDFRPVFVSFLKNCLSHYGQAFFDEYYKDRDTIMKSFTFGVRMNRPKFNGGVVLLGGNRITFTLSTFDMRDGMIIYNAVMQRKLFTFPLPNQNSMKIISVNMVNLATINQSEIVVKMLSPLVVREHDKASNTDVYVDCSQEDFAERTKTIVAAQLSRLGMDERLMDGFSITPVIPKKTVVLSFKFNIDVSLGVYKLSGNPKLLNFLHQAGIGSRRSQGFGMFEVLT